jgi:phosphoglycolate phosphatase
MIRHVIWDWNGTLFDDVDVCIRSMNSLLSKYDLPRIGGADEYRSKFRFPVSEYYRLLGFDFSDTPFPALANEFIALYQSASTDCALSPNAEKTLSDIAKRAIPQIILSASEQRNLESQVGSFPIGAYFDAILGINDIYARTKESIAHSWLASSGLSEREILMIGDTFHDYEIARNIGCHCVLYKNGHQHIPDHLEHCTVVAVLDDIVPALEKIL